MIFTGLTQFDPNEQPNERRGLVIDQMECAQNIPERVFEASRVAAYANPKASAKAIAESVASFYGYTNQAARRVFFLSVEQHIIQRLGRR